MLICKTFVIYSLWANLILVLLHLTIFSLSAVLSVKYCFCFKLPMTMSVFTVYFSALNALL